MSSASTAAAAAKSCLLWLPYGVRCLLRISAAAASAAFLAELLKGLVLGGYCRRVMRVCEYREYQAGCVYFTKASGEGVQCKRFLGCSSWRVHRARWLRERRERVAIIVHRLILKPNNHHDLNPCTPPPPCSSTPPLKPQGMPAALCSSAACALRGRRKGRAGFDREKGL